MTITRPAVSTRVACALAVLFLTGFARSLAAQPRATAESVDRAVAAVNPRVVAWRRDIHEHPELSNRESRTGALVAAHLKALGLEVRSGVAKTGVVAVLRGARPGPAVALRADMDGLPVTEESTLPFKSLARGSYNGQDVGVMHACGHDAHTAMLMGAAEVLAGMRAQLAGSVTFIFQPGEEGPPAGEEDGAAVMVREGALENPHVNAIFGLHVWPEEAGKISYKSGGAMSAADGLRIVVHGKQTHGAQPWRGVDPIVVSAQVITALQTITARQTDITLAPAVVTIGMINGGVRNNIIPDSVVMVGTVRTFDDAMRLDVQKRITRTAQKIAEASGATAEVTISGTSLVLVNDPALTERMAPTIRQAAAAGRVNANAVWMPSEDFPAFTRNIPGLYLFLGVNARGVAADDAAPNHSPRFFVNEEALSTGVRAMVLLALDYLSGAK